MIIVCKLKSLKKKLYHNAPIYSDYHIYSNEPNVFHLITGSVLKGDSFRIHDHATIPITQSDIIRLANDKDFDDYRIERTQYSKPDCVNEYIYNTDKV